MLRDLPGVVVACPSNGPDAAKMLRHCVKLAHEQGRVVVFLEPIALYMCKDLHQPGDNQWLFDYPAPNESVELGEVSLCGEGDTVILTYGNGYYLSRQAQKLLDERENVSTKVVDLRWLSPLPKAAIINAVAGAKRVLIVDEGRKSGSVSEALVTLLVESLEYMPKIARITGEDCFIPLGDAWTHVLPSRDKIIEAVLNLMKDAGEQSGRLSIT